MTNHQTIRSPGIVTLLISHAYDPYHNSDTYPGKNVMDGICQAYDVQPGDLIYWDPPGGEQQDD